MIFGAAVAGLGSGVSGFYFKVSSPYGCERWGDMNCMID